MDRTDPQRIIIAGAGIGGLTAALSFAARGFDVQLFERAAKFAEIGAGIQLSPNATRILDRLGVLASLADSAAMPEAVVLRDAASLAELARVPLGKNGEARWKSPYLVAHRADLHSALLAHASRQSGIRLAMNSVIRNVSFDDKGVTADVCSEEAVEAVRGRLLVGADGVWSEMRRFVAGSRESRPTGKMAWRALVDRRSPAGRALAEATPADSVTAFLHPALHLIVYPVRGGAAFNLVALMKGDADAGSWTNKGDAAVLAEAMRGFVRPLSELAETARPWSSWPIHAVDPGGSWVDARGLALIGDAAHAMTPFAAQGAAMAIEDAFVLAALMAAKPDAPASALARYEQMRRPRIRRVARRGAFNHFAWHAAGPVALARNAVLRFRPSASLARDFDWLYGWDAENVLGK